MNHHLPGMKTAGPDETRRRKARELRYRKPVARDIHFDMIRQELWDIMEECDHVRYYFEDDGDSLVNALDGDDEEAYEFKMMFADLAAAMHRASLLPSSFLRFLQFACMDSFLPAFEGIWMRYSWSGGMWKGREKKRKEGRETCIKSNTGIRMGQGLMKQSRGCLNR